MLPPNRGLGSLGPRLHLPVRGVKIPTVYNTVLIPAMVTTSATTTSTSPTGETRLVQECPAVAWLMLVAGMTLSLVRYQVELVMLVMKDPLAPPTMKVLELDSALQ